MDKIEPGITPGTMYNHDITIDESKFPKRLIDLLRDMEKYDEEGNFIMYDASVDELETVGKNMMLNNGLSESDYKLLMIKYGGELW